MSIGATPMFRPLMGLMAGVFWAAQFGPMPEAMFFIAGIWLGNILLLLFSSTMPHFFLIRGVGLWLLYGIMGCCLFQIQNQPATDHWDQGQTNEDIFVARILEQVPRASHIQLVLSVKCRINKQGTCESTSGKALLLVRKEDNQTIFKRGSLIGFCTVFGPVRKAQNPYSFNPAAYWAGKNIRKQAWVGAEEVILLEPAPEMSLPFFREQVLQILRRFLPEEEHFGIAAALVLGDKTFLDKDLKASYAESGAIHVLAVSGLHVGLVYALFFWLINKLSLIIPLVRRFRLIVLLLLLLGYAGFTGAAPSVCRAVLMLSCWLIGKALCKTPSGFNVVCVSAFVLLVFDSNLLFDLGFQLSYSAVLGILFLYPLILRAWAPRFSFTQHAWKLLSVSVAAQLGTLPWSLYYFHQFPTYFGLSSLLVIPLISFVLVMAFACLIFSWQPQLSDLLGWLLESLIDVCNEIVLYIQQLPMALLRDIWIGEADIVLYFLILIIMLRALDKLSYHLALIQVALLLLWGGMHMTIGREEQLSSSLIIYHTNDFFAADWLEKGHLLSLSDAKADSLQLQYSSAGWRSFRGMTNPSIQRLPEQFARSDTALYWTINQEQFLFVGPASRFLPQNADTSSETILLVDPTNPWVEKWLCRGRIRLLVLIPKKIIREEWKNLASELGISVWSIKEKGAFEYKY